MSRTVDGVRMAAAWAVALLLLFAGATKLGDPARFAIEIGNYRLVSPLVAGLLAVYLPWLEIALGLGLCVPRWRPAARLLATGLLLVFCVALVAALARGIDIRCGCFGRAGGSTSAGWALARNAGLIALLAVACPWRRGHRPAPIAATPR